MLLLLRNHDSGANVPPVVTVTYPLERYREPQAAAYSEPAAARYHEPRAATN